MNIKAHALLTQHYASARGLPRDIREDIPREVLAKPHIYPRDLGPTVMRELTRRFREALAPLAGKLGVVLFQFPVWFPISSANKSLLRRIRHDFRNLRVAIELRNETWMSRDNRLETLELLADEDLICMSASTSRRASSRRSHRSPRQPERRRRSHARPQPGALRATAPMAAAAAAGATSTRTTSLSDWASRSTPSRRAPTKST